MIRRWWWRFRDSKINQEYDQIKSKMAIQARNSKGRAYHSWNHHEFPFLLEGTRQIAIQQQEEQCSSMMDHHNYDAARRPEKKKSSQKKKTKKKYHKKEENWKLLDVVICLLTFTFPRYFTNMMDRHPSHPSPSPQPGTRKMTIDIDATYFIICTSDYIRLRQPDGRSFTI